MNKHEVNKHVANIVLLSIAIILLKINARTRNMFTHTGSFVAITFQGLGPNLANELLLFLPQAKVSSRVAVHSSSLRIS